MCLSSLDSTAAFVLDALPCFLDHVMCSVLDIVLFFPEAAGKSPMCDDQQITSALGGQFPKQFIPCTVCVKQ